MNDNRIAKIATQGRVDGKRSGARPRKSWEECVRNDLEKRNLGWEAATWLTAERKIWRTV